MPQVVEIPIAQGAVPKAIELPPFQLPQAVHDRLQFLLDRQDDGILLPEAKRGKQRGWWSWLSFCLCYVFEHKE
jgi:hypothetical protein